MEGGKRGRVGRKERKKEREGADIREEKETGVIYNGTRNKNVMDRVLRKVTEGTRSNGTDSNVVLVAHTTRGG